MSEATLAKTILESIGKELECIDGDIAMWTGIVAGNVLKAGDNIKSATDFDTQHLEFSILKNRLEEGLRELGKLEHRKSWMLFIRKKTEEMIEKGERQ